jgi:hypothetical protein
VKCWIPLESKHPLLLTDGARGRLKPCHLLDLIYLNISKQATNWMVRWESFFKQGLKKKKQGGVT